jgi:hypothetical protein
MLGWFLLLTGCSYYPVYGHNNGYGPPSHAPAHGYRYKHQGHDLVYDSGLGAYVVVGMTGVYFYDGIYYRYTRDHWYYTRDLGKNWRLNRGDRGLPPGLAKKYMHDKNKNRR